VTDVPPPPPRLPPPPPSGFAAPQPPPVAAATPGAAVPASPTDTAGLRKAAIVLFWLAAGATVVLTVAFISRKAVWSDFESGGDVSFSDLDAADGFVGGAALLLAALGLATTIVVSIWSLRVARHAQRAGAAVVSPGLACGGWYIPVANTIVPFIQLRRAADHLRRRTSWLNAWQALVIVSFLLWVGLRGSTGDGALDPGDDVSAMLDREVVFGVLLSISTLATALAATKALSDLERPS
jgi:hypothetical protein